jgi:hypothetical protein
MKKIPPQLFFVLMTMILFHPFASAKGPDFSVTSTEILNEFEVNKLAAELKYKKKSVSIKGVIKEVKSAERFNQPDTVEIQLASDANMFSSVTLYLVPEAGQIDAATKLRTGDFATIKCDRGVKPSLLGVQAEGCVIETKAQSDKAVEIDSFLIALKFNTAERDEVESAYLGKKVRTTIFIERFEQIDSGRRMIDGNSGFFCDVDRSQVKSFPTQKGSYTVEGVFVVVSGKPGLSRCNIAK